MSNNNIKEEEKRLSTLYGVIESKPQGEFILPQTVTKKGLRKYIKDMIRINQPRRIRDEGRPSFSIEDYKIPVNYFIVESNTVSYHSAKGAIFIDPDDFDDYMDAGGSNVKETVPNKFRDDDIGQQVVLHIFKHGRRTIDELIADLQGLDKHMLTILVNKLVDDGYLQKWKGDKGEGGKKKLLTLELVPKEINKAIPDKKHDRKEEEGEEKKTNITG